MARYIVFVFRAVKPSPTYRQAAKAAGLVFVLGIAPTDPRQIRSRKQLFRSRHTND